MNFLNPLVLFALFAAAIPVILHLLNLRKLKNIQFSTLKFLKELQKTKIRKLKLKQIILLILRTLIVVFAVLAFSRPTVKSHLPLFATYTKSSVIIIIDNSMSTDVSDEFGNRFNQIKNNAKSIINGLKEGDEAALIVMTDNSTPIKPSFSRNLNFIREEIVKLRLSNNTANLETSMRKADALAQESNNMNKEIFIISDAQPNTFFKTATDSLKYFNPETAVYYLPIGSKSKAEFQNLSIDSLNLITRIFHKGKLIESEAFIRNNSKKDATGVLVSLFFNNERVAQRTLDIQANQSKTVSISAEAINSGLVGARLEIEPDALESDNKRYFSFIIPDKIRIALIGDEEKNKYIRLALAASQNGSNSVETSSYGINEISSFDFSAFETIILAEPNIKQSDFNRLNEFVQNGGGLFIFAGESDDFVNLKIGLNILGFGNPELKTFSTQQPSGFSKVDRIHPLFEGVFKGTTDKRTIVESPKIYKALTVNAGFPLVNIPGGIFLSESKTNGGKVIYCAVPPSMGWSSLPMTGIFPAMIFRSLYYLPSMENLGANHIIGTNLLLNIPRKYASAKSLKIIDPMMTESSRQIALLPSGAFLPLDDISLPGIYSVYSSDGKPVSVVSANISSSESNLKNYSNAEINKFMGVKLNKGVYFSIPDYMADLRNLLTRARTGTELWQLFVVLALISMVAEMIISKSSKQDDV